MKTSKRDWVDAPLLVADALQRLPVPRTEAPLTSAFGPLTYHTERVLYASEIVRSLPCVLIDINDEQPARYRYEGDSLDRGIPLTVVVFVPVLSYQEGLTNEQRAEYARLADEDIKTLISDLETVLNAEPVRRTVGKHLEIDTAGIMNGELEWAELSTVRARVGELWLTVFNKVRGH